MDWIYTNDFKVTNNSARVLTAFKTWKLFILIKDSITLGSNYHSLYQFYIKLKKINSWKY